MNDFKSPKPCPKCNSVYVVVEYTPHYLWYVACTKCGCMTNLHEDMLEAEEEWENMHNV